jgi:tetratricopeptide (TPR) repeat protein
VILRPTIVMLMLVIAVVGCGPKPMEADVIASAQAAYTKAMDAYQQKNYAEAGELFTTAISGGGVNADQYGEALLARAVCRAKLGDYEGALADVDTAAQGADPAQVHVTRSFIFAKQGRTSDANTELTAARRLNRSVRPIDD